MQNLRSVERKDLVALMGVTDRRDQGYCEQQRPHGTYVFILPFILLLGPKFIAVPQVHSAAYVPWLSMKLPPTPELASFVGRCAGYTEMVGVSVASTSEYWSIDRQQITKLCAGIGTVGAKCVEGTR